MYELKLYKGIMCHDNEKRCKNWKQIYLLFQNWHEKFDEFWPEHSKISKSFILMGCFWREYIIFELNKYRGVMFDGTEYWCKFGWKNDLCCQKWYEEFGKFSPEHSEISKLGLWWDLFIQIIKCMNLKFTGELYVMTRNEDAKIEGDLTCQFQIDARNLTKFDQSTQKSQKFAP